MADKNNKLAQVDRPEDTPLALLCGGDSTEREISLASGAGALAALQAAGFPVTVYDPADEKAMAQLEAAVCQGEIKAAFLCVHGKNGEDGVLQARLEAIGLPYTGSGVEASKRAINKGTSKAIYREVGLTTPQGITLRRRDCFGSGEDGACKASGAAETDNAAETDSACNAGTAGEPTGSLGSEGNGCPFDIDAIVACTGSHCVVKASRGGSTIGIYIVERPEDLPQAIAAAFEYDDEVVVERYIAGKEYTVAVIGNDKPQALPVIEIIPQHGFYDYEAKYTPGGSTHLCPAPISDELTARLQENACRAHKALGCKGMSRTDFIVDGEGVAWVLETNTIPGMTKTSLLPDAAAVADIPFSELCSYFVALALEE